MVTQNVPERRQFVRYSFYKARPSWRALAPAEREASKRELAGVVEHYAQRFMLRPYSTMGMRADTDFMLWTASECLEDIQGLASALASTALGAHLDTPHSFLAMTRRSIYVDEHSHPGQEGSRTLVRPPSTRYLFVYPFVKTRAWYRLPQEQRQAMMTEHITTGHRYPSVRIHTAYSFGLDDQEFVVAFDTDKPADFLDLVMELRESAASSFTERDTPIFSCIAMPIGEVLDALGG